MAGFIDYPIESDPRTLATQMLASFASRGYALDAAGITEALIQTIAYRVSETRVVMADVARSIFTTYGETIVGIAPVAAARATVESTWTMTDMAGYTIPAGTLVYYPLTGDQRVAFELASNLVVEPGSTTATGVELQAVVEGTDANGLPAATLEGPGLTAVVSVATTATTAGGVDAETDAEYADRLSQRLRLLADVPILPDDFAVLAGEVDGVHRALAIDGYDPTGPSTGNERMVAVAVVDENGAAVSAGVKTAVDADLEARREVNFVVHVIDPTAVPVTVVFTATAADGYDPVQVEAAAEAAVDAYLDPGTWAGGGDSPPVWRAERAIRYNALVALIEGVAGVASLDTLTINGATSNLDLSSGGTVVAPLPNPTVTGTVS